MKDTMDKPHLKTVATLPLFDPEVGSVVAEPPGNQEGCWAGAPSALYDDSSGTFYLSYRIRTLLRDHGRAGRGGETRVAVSSNGTDFEIIWTASKEEFDALSIEKSCLMLTPEGRFRLYVSYSSAHDYRWRIDMLEADDPRDFDAAKRVSVLSPENTGTEGVKDPVTVIAGGLWHMYVNTVFRPPGSDYATLDRMHREGNAYVAGVVSSCTALATSPDGQSFDWVGEVLPAGSGWDGYLARMSALVYTPPFFTAIYDGRPNSGANYSDRPGLAITHDLRTFHKVDIGRAMLRSPHGRGTLRYVECLRVGDALHYFYEMARPDFSHELRTAKVAL